jgi:hypothetical protein
MARHEGDPQRLARAKQEAVARFLPAAAAPRRRFVALAAAISRRHNIVGVGVGPKIRNGRSTPAPSIRFYVEKKVPLRAIPKADRVPERINGVATDVVETGRFFAQVPIARRRLRPAKGGCSVGFKAADFVMAGSFGCLVTDGRERFILSNNHVLADENALPLSSPIFQPGLLDGGVVPGDRIARLTRFVRLRKLPAQNRVDAAIAALDAPGMAVPSILPRIGALGSTAPGRAAVGMRVHKHGRTSGYTRGRVIDVSADVNVTYGFGVARFVNQMIIVDDAGSFSRSGDSGSLVVRRTDNRATGLLFAGSGSHTIANHIGDVLAALSVTLVA